MVRSFLKKPNQRLYNLGARKFVLMSVNPNGCTPMARTMIPMHERCIQSVNRAIHLFNTNLKAMVDEIQLELPASKLVYVNSYKIVRDIIKEPSSKGNLPVSIITHYLLPMATLHYSVITFLCVSVLLHYTKLNRATYAWNFVQNTYAISIIHRKPLIVYDTCNRYLYLHSMPSWFCLELFNV